MAVDRLRMIHRQWVQEQQALHSAEPRSVERFQILGRLRRLQDEVAAVDPQAQDVFAREFLEGYNSASAEEKKTLQSETASPALRSGLMRLQANYVAPAEASARSSEVKKPPTQRKSIYEGCHHEVFLSGNVAAIKRIGQDVKSRLQGKPHDSSALADIQRAVGRNKNNDVMTPRQATESLTRTAKKLFIRLNDNGRHPKWEKPTQAELELWQEIEGIVKARMVKKILSPDSTSEDPNVQRLRELLQGFITRFIPEGKRAQELFKWIDAKLNDALEPQEVLREFDAELHDWRKEHANDNQAPLQTVPEYKYDMPSDNGVLPEVEINRSIFGLFEMKALVGLALANNNWKLRFKGTELGQFIIPKDMMEELRVQFSKNRSSIAELQNDTNVPMLETRQLALQKFAALVDGQEELLKHQTIPVSSFDAKEQQRFDTLVQSFLGELQQNSKRLGGVEAMSEFLLTDKIVAVTIRTPKSAVPQIDRNSIGTWEASPAVAAAIISPSQ